VNLLLVLWPPALALSTEGGVASGTGTGPTREFSQEGRTGRGGEGREGWGSSQGQAPMVAAGGVDSELGH